MTEFGQKVSKISAMMKVTCEMAQEARCIGIFVMFVAKKFLWTLTESGQPCDRAYFCEVIPQKHVIPFPRRPINVLDTNKIAYLHDKAPA